MKGKKYILWQVINLKCDDTSDATWRCWRLARASPAGSYGSEAPALRLPSRSCSPCLLRTQETAGEQHLARPGLVFSQGYWQNPETMQSSSFHPRAAHCDVCAWCGRICGPLLTGAGGRLNPLDVQPYSRSGLTCVHYSTVASPKSHGPRFLRACILHLPHDL